MNLTVSQFFPPRIRKCIIECQLASVLHVTNSDKGTSTEGLYASDRLVSMSVGHFINC